MVASCVSFRVWSGQQKGLTIEVPDIWDDFMLDPALGTDSSDAAGPRCLLVLEGLQQLVLEPSLPLVKGDALVNASPGEPGALAVLGGKLVDVDVERVVGRADLDLLPFLTKLPGGGGGVRG